MNSLRLRAENLSFAYGEQAPLFADLDLELKVGSLTTVLGANGVGKTTLIQLLAGLLSPQKGRILLGEKPLSQWSIEERARHVAFVPQQAPSGLSFTVEEIVLMGRNPYLGSRLFESDEDRRVAAEAMDSVEVGHLSSRLFDQCSGGEQQRVLIARALAQKPEILFLDEPTSNLDLGHQAGLFTLLEHVRSEYGTTVCAVLHDWNLASTFASHVVLLDDGQMTEGPFDTVVTDEVVARLFSSRVDVVRNEKGERYVVPKRGREIL